MTDLKIAPVVAAQQRQPLCMSAWEGAGPHFYPPAYHCSQGNLSCGLHMNRVQVLEEEISSVV